MSSLYPLRLESSLHETIWGGQRLELDGWKRLPEGARTVGESWETEISNRIENGPHAGKTLGELVTYLGAPLLGKQAISIFGERFPLLAKFIDANAKLSVQVHPNDDYAARNEHGKLGKTEFWYILAAEPGASIIHGFQVPSNSEQVQNAIESVALESLLHEEPVQAGDVVFVPAGTVHAIGSGILLYELQEYSDVTYRMYDYGRRDASGKTRELHIERSLDVSHYHVSPHVKVRPIVLSSQEQYEERCLIACQYFVTREVNLKARGVLQDTTTDSCVILTSLGASLRVAYGPDLEQGEQLERGETIVLPAELGTYRLEGEGLLLRSYVPSAEDEAWRLWRQHNHESSK
ncbi:type I phosphomannose isomerase catalytic subunit [Ktedonospora formicarum]|uniref:Mannose-6-phosphate isomerase n=1 Tax=Ktedonospora formicarum TaxID=2778364 RepID=A0A8J3I3A2_9CHLR|nr:type I phosphomannose isomerase catalytic subunit [Ktedonospora formicarum]GHO45427.1 mannose-6-phosphate isomerase [Ktedonospora formicarum]